MQLFPAFFRPNTHTPVHHKQKRIALYPRPRAQSGAYQNASGRIGAHFFGATDNHFFNVRVIKLTFVQTARRCAQNSIVRAPSDRLHRHIIAKAVRQSQPPTVHTNFCRAAYRIAIITPKYHFLPKFPTFPPNLYFHIKKTTIPLRSAAAANAKASSTLSMF